MEKSSTKRQKTVTKTTIITTSDGKRQVVTEELKAPSMKSTLVTDKRKERVEELPSTATSNVFSRLTAPTKAAIGKSRRQEDRNAREQWTKSMNQQLDYEESLMNMGGFVLKEQRYKKIEDRPGTSKKTVGSRLKQITKTSETERFQVETNSHSFSESKGLIKREVMSSARDNIDYSAEKGASTSHYFGRPTANKSATKRSHKANFLKSPFATGNSKRGFTMGGRTSEKRTEDAPGPGMYEYKSKAIEGPEYSIYGKYPTKYESLPGPGDYDYQLKTNSGCTMGGKFSDYKTDEFPGPGAYDSWNKNEGIQYSMYPKREQKYEQTPGPGDYELLKEQPKGITIGGKQAPARHEELPGPGQYTQRSMIVEGPMYSIYQKRDKKIESTPGPGDYENIIRMKEGVTVK